MPRYKLTIEYDGTPYAGWQIQEGQPTVQACIGAAVEGFCGQIVTIFGAGRTDSGVHATAQIAHIDLAREYPPDTVRNAINYHLRPAPISIVSAEAVASDFDARFSATMRHYRYRIINRRAPLALERTRAWRVSPYLDAEKMHKAAQALVGKHDFTTFRSVHCQAETALKTLGAIAVKRDGDEIIITTSARSFLHRQVRSMVGSLRQVGDGKWPIEAMGEILRACDRAACGAVAPAHGLYLVAVDYPHANGH